MQVYEIILVPITKQKVKRGVIIVIADLQHYNKDKSTTYSLRY